MESVNGESTYSHSYQSSGESSYNGESSHKNNHGYYQKPYKNKNLLKKQFLEKKQHLQELQDEITNLIQESELLPKSCSKTKAMIEEKIKSLKEYYKKEYNSFVKFALENSDIFNIEIKDIDIYER